MVGNVFSGITTFFNCVSEYGGVKYAGSGITTAQAVANRLMLKEIHENVLQTDPFDYGSAVCESCSYVWTDF